MRFFAGRKQVIHVSISESQVDSTDMLRLSENKTATMDIESAGLCQVLLGSYMQIPTIINGMKKFEWEKPKMSYEILPHFISMPSKILWLVFCQLAANFMKVSKSVAEYCLLTCNEIKCKKKK